MEKVVDKNSCSRSIDSHDLFGDGIDPSWNNLRTSCPDIAVKTADKLDPLLPTGHKLSHQKSVYILTEPSLRFKFEDRFKDELQIIVNPTTIILHLDDDVDVEGAEAAFLDMLMELQSEVVYRVEKFGEDAFYLTLKHFDHFVGKSPGIIAQIFEETFEIGFTCKYEYEAIINHHLDIVKQPVDERTMSLFDREHAIVEASQALLHKLSAKVTIKDDIVILQGFADDVKDANIFILRLFHDCIVQVREFPSHALEIVRRQEVWRGIEQRTRNRPELKDIWWKYENGRVTAVGRNSRLTSDMISLIIASVDRILLHLNSIGVSRFKELKDSLIDRFDQNVDITIDDTDQQTVKVVFTCDIEEGVRGMINHFENNSKTRTEKLRTDFRSCIYVRDYLSDRLRKEHQYEEFKLSPICDPSNSVIEITGTDETISDIGQMVHQITTRKFGIPDYERGKRLLDSMLLGDEIQYTVSVEENMTLIKLKTGKIEDENVDVIVNSAAPDLILSHREGSIARDIAAAAGREVQERISEIYRNVKQPIPHGTVVPSLAGNLKCNQIYHCVFSCYDRDRHEECIRDLRLAAEECLHRASRARYTSISFPAICTGVLGYPHTVVIETLADVFVSYINSDTDVVLHELNIVVLPTDTTTQRVFNAYLAGRTNSLVAAAQKKYLIRSPPWICPFYCHVTAASEEALREAAGDLDDEMGQQTFEKR